MLHHINSKTIYQVKNNCDPSLGVSGAYAESNASLLTCKHVISSISILHLFLMFNIIPFSPTKAKSLRERFLHYFLHATENGGVFFPLPYPCISSLFCPTRQICVNVAHHKALRVVDIQTIVVRKLFSISLISFKNNVVFSQIIPRKCIHIIFI